MQIVENRAALASGAVGFMQIQRLWQDYSSLIAACAAARRAMGTRNGLQET